MSKLTSGWWVGSVIRFLGLPLKMEQDSQKRTIDCPIAHTKNEVTHLASRCTPPERMHELNKYKAADSIPLVAPDHTDMMAPPNAKSIRGSMSC